MDKKFVGNGWENQWGGMNISIKKSEIIDLEANDYGDIKLQIGKLKQVNPKSKATHWIALKEDKLKEEDTSKDLPF